MKIKKIIKIIKKQIPKNPKIGTKITLLDSFGAPEPPEYEWKCPHCEATVQESNFYCHFCGQSLEWDKWEV